MGIGNFLKREIKGFTSGITAQDGVQDWQHAAKVFTAEDMIRSPKFKGMFHVTFVFNNDALDNVTEAKEFAESMGNKNSDILSVLTKGIELPNFNIDHTIHNQYNKTTVTYKKIKYNPITITFHDDMSDIIWAFWAFYYNWYFADGTKNIVKATGDNKNKMRDPFKKLVNAVSKTIKAIFKKSKTTDPKTNSANQTEDKQADTPGLEWDMAAKYPLLLEALTGVSSDTSGMFKDAWGMNGSVFHATGTDKAYHLLKQIEIYPLGQKQASKVIIHNPKIIRWSHDTFDYSDTATATCKMEVVYESVSYQDQISAATVLQTVRFYDKHSSPLMRGSPRSLLGPGGLLDRAGGIIGNVLSGKAGIGDLISAVGIAKTLGNKNFSKSVKSELSGVIKDKIQTVGVSAVTNKTFPNKGTTKNGG